LQIVSFGYTAEQSLLYGTPGGAVEVVALVVSGYLGDRYKNRILISMVGLTTALIGMILIVALPLTNNGGRLAGYYLTQASPTPFVALLSLISTNVAGYTKKTTIAALYLIGYCVGNIIGTLFIFIHLRVTRINPNCHFNRTPNIPPLRRTTLHASRDHDHRVLGRLFGRPGFHLLVLPKAEPEEGIDETGGWVCQVAESGMVGSHRWGEPGVCL
jgi:hypothetical protein